VDQALYVQYGCGWSAPPRWLNFDASPTLRFERLPMLGRLYTRNAAPFPANAQFGDIVRGLPVADGSCKGVYCSHVLEHLALHDCRTALRQTLKLLRPGGTFRMVLPDLEQSVRLYLANPTSEAASDFMVETGLGQAQRPRGLKGLAVGWLGNSQHLWMWDYKAMSRELAAAGFADIRRASFGDSADPRFNDVEDQGRWENALGVECRRPG
jgi:hypothetical protein